ncbi:hypothetical protein VPHD69_0226 [Vibrio phage D69]
MHHSHWQQVLFTNKEEVMTGISNCSVEVHTGPSDAQVDVVQGLQELMMKQLEVLGQAHKNLKPSNNDIIGIKVDGAGQGTTVTGCHIEGADTGMYINGT